MEMESLWHDLLEAERQMRRAAEDLARRWREAFFSVAAAAADYEAHLRAGTLPQSPEDAAAWLSGVMAGWRTAVPSCQENALKAEVERLKAEVERLKAEAERLKAQAEGPKPRPAPPQGTAAERRPSVRPPEPPNPPRPAPPPPQARTDRERNGAHPAALGETHPAPPLDVSELQRFLAGIKPPPEFQGEFFARDGLLVATIGYTGVSSRPRLAKTLAAALGVSSKSGSITRCFDRCERLGLVKTHKEPGAPFSLVDLTERGKETFRKMFGYNPVPSEAELLLRGHPGNITHAVYCVWAREFAEVAGYEVEIPDRPVVPISSADLVFRWEREVLYVEVERALSGDPISKWRAVAQKREKIAVITPDKETGERVSGYLEQVSVRQYLVTDFSHLVTIQPKTPEEFWRIRKSG